MVKDLLQRAVVLCSILFLSCSVCFSTSLQSFEGAKKLARVLFNDNRVTLYCSCLYDDDKQIDLDSCSMQQAAPIDRSNRVEWEHMMPAEHFGRYHKCWNEPICTNDRTGKPYKGRKCCKRVDSDFKVKEGELYNLWPSVGSVNQARSNYEYGVLTNKRSFYGCAFAVDSDLRIAEPPDSAKGIVARANLFMVYKYKVKISQSQKLLFEQWNKLYPPTPWEKEWAKEVAFIEGYANPYIS